jgi:hypothetical protein
MEDAVVIEARGWPQPPQMARRSYIQTRCVVQFFLGVIAACVGATLLWGFMLRGDRGWTIFATAFLLLGIVVMAVNFRTLTRVAQLPEDRNVPITLPYSFAIEGDEVVFPAFVATPEERWPLRETSAKAARVLDLVTLTSPGRRTRRFFAVALRIPTVEAADLVNDHRLALEESSPGPQTAPRPIDPSAGSGIGA